MPRRNSLQDRIEKFIAKKNDAVFLTDEFYSLGGQRQVLRALGKIVAAGRLIKLGYGIYGRAERSALSGQPMLAASKGFVGASRTALNKLGVQWEPSEWEKRYNDGRSTQVPVNAVVRVRGRFNRKLSYRGKTLTLERGNLP